MKFMILLLVAGCAQVTSLNLKKHEFGLLPTKIIWFQVAGLEEEQLAMLRFQQTSTRKTSFEENTCVGKTWNYDLYDIRTPAQVSFLSQITGKKNIKQTCEDTSLRPIWSYLSSHGYNTAIFEIGGTGEQAILNALRCGDQGKAFLSPTTIFLRKEPVPQAKTFHYTEEVPFKENEVYYDRSCNKNDCFSSITDDFKVIYQRLRRYSQKNMLIVRDFSYLAALEKKDFKLARKILSDLETAYSEALTYAKQSNDFLILLTTGDSRFVDMPDQGKNWFEYEKTGTGPQVKRTKLTNLVLASGARAENFCGIYEDSKVFERILSGPKQQGLELKIINPFK